MSYSLSRLKHLSLCLTRSGLPECTRLHGRENLKGRVDFRGGEDPRERRCLSRRGGPSRVVMGLKPQVCDRSEWQGTRLEGEAGTGFESPSCAMVRMTCFWRVVHGF